MHDLVNRRVQLGFGWTVQTATGAATWRSSGMPPITLRLDGPAPALDGFRYWWLKYIRGFNRDEHCARCFVGPYSKRVRRDMPTGQVVTLDEHDDWSHVYLCGVAMRGGWKNNFHLALRPAAPGEAAPRIVAPTYNGFTVAVEGAVQLAIPPLPPGFRGLDAHFTTCRNFQFGVAYLEAPAGDITSSSIGPPR
jgi:hypothetical protein